ncbi:SDR family oxidoreductase [Paraferrimonas sp. SM1919]|uniref:SDR family oxidoreductase n=1 Tax=Paraferrimonas sp. SM1919 TaxID=2662263 RepID=UPI0013D6F704|nr:SDR family oxidoreductase [Paraferrimonas sp. SM1919]
MSEYRNQKRAFITGAGSGLGRELAKCYANFGYKLALVDVNAEGLEQTAQSLHGCEVLTMIADVTRLSDLEKAKDEIVKQWGGVDVIINNAGIGGTFGGIDKVSIKDWQQVLDINLLGVVRGCKAFTPVFKTQGGGHIINIASSAGQMTPPKMAAYNVAKAGVIALSETLRFELDRDNIGVTVVCPAFFTTNLTSSIKSDSADVVNRVDRIMAKSEISAADIAQMIFEAQQTQKFMLLPHKFERRLWLYKRFMPESFAKSMQKQMKKLFKRG